MKSFLEHEFVKIIRENGGRIFLVGGFVRDEILGKFPHDKDYVITGFGEENLSSLFSNSIKKIGGRFPIFTAYIDGILCEIALARFEKKTGEGYKGFTPIFNENITIEEDLFRRDTTMNSIAKELPNGEIIDPYNGINDIKSKIIRATSKHFLEDPVRALRAARQAAEHDFIIEENTLILMEKCREELKKEPSERFFLEMEKALNGKKPSLFFEILAQTNLLEVTFKWIYDLMGKTQPTEFHPEGDAFVHSMKILDMVAKKTNSRTARFCALVHDIGKGRTPKEMLPHHYGHENIGIEVLNEWNEKMTILRNMRKAANFVIKEHMRAPRLKKITKIVTLLMSIKNSGLSAEDFAIIIEADHGKMPIFLKYAKELIEEMEKISGRDAPENLQGVEIKNWILREQVNIYKRFMAEIE